MTLEWSYCVLDGSGAPIDEKDADRVHSTASVGKLFLLCEAAELIVSGALDPDRPVTRDPALRVEDSGLWQHLRQDELPLADVCQLIGAVSDNWATNALLDIVGLDAVQVRARALGCEHSGLHDYVRIQRLPEHAPMLSSGTARELAEVARRIHAAAGGDHVEGITAAAAAMVERWLLVGVDLSLVGAPFTLDPLAHTTGDVLLWAKTGFDVEVRADVGVAWRGSRALAYAALATWSRGSHPGRRPVDLMSALGQTLAADLRGTAG